jgi:soluble lytic murein transglycosylase-like protein
MSIEFGIDLGIVLIVDELARSYVNPNDPEWRVIRTPEFMTHIMLSLIYAESKGKAKAIGDRGRAYGLTQIWHTTAAQYGDVSAELLLEPEVNIDYAFRHLSYLLRKYKGNLALSLYSWNRGEGTVDRLIRHGQPPNNTFGPKIYRAALDAKDLVEAE